MALEPKTDDELKFLSLRHIRAHWDKILAESWVYLQPSRYEGFGLAVAEAMACGTVPIVSRAGALPEIVGDAGVILSVTSPDSLATSLLLILDDTTRFHDLEKRCVEQAARFSRGKRRELLKLAIDGNNAR